MNDKGTWDRFVEESPYSMLFHRWDFLKIVEKYSGYRLLPYGIYKGNELICMFPAFFRARNGLKLLYSPPPQTQVYVPYLGFIVGPSFDGHKQHKKEHLIDLIASDINREVKRLSPNHISIASAPGLVDFRPFKWTGYTIGVDYTYIIDLKRPLEEIWNSFSQDCRKSIRDCEKRPLTFRPSEDVDTFLALARSTLAKKGVTFFHQQVSEYLKEIQRTFPDNVKMSFLYDGDVLVGAANVCKYKKRYLFWMFGLGKGDYGTYMNWAHIKMARDEGYSEVENWGTEQKLLCAYKSKFNPRLEACYNLYKDDAVGKLASWTYTSITGNQLLNALITKEIQ